MGRSVGFAVERLLGVERGLNGVADAADDLSIGWRVGVFVDWCLDKVREYGAAGFMVAGSAHGTLRAEKD